MTDDHDLESLACQPAAIDPADLNYAAIIPYGCQVQDVANAMKDFTVFLGFVNQQLFSRGIARLESLLMPANFSSIVGEFVGSSIPRYCHTLVRNRYHNGHADLIRAGQFEDDAVRYTTHGIEIKASRYVRGWQGHNAEEIWLMIFVFDSNRPQDQIKGIPPKPFCFRLVAGAMLDRSDWTFVGRSATSRRTITAAVNRTGYRKIMANWIYRDMSLK